jgi:hypothetical protein
MAWRYGLLVDRHLGISGNHVEFYIGLAFQSGGIGYHEGCARLQGLVDSVSQRWWQTNARRLGRVQRFFVFTGMTGYSDAIQRRPDVPVSAVFESISINNTNTCLPRGSSGLSIVIRAGPISIPLRNTSVRLWAALTRVDSGPCRDLSGCQSKSAFWQAAPFQQPLA